ncbi:MAG TPA: ABC transporter ATP-binding protein [Burkholderiaceae bacterium]
MRRDSAAPRNADPILEVRGLAKRFGERWVLRDLDLSVRRGSIVALRGESGTGKSTLLNLIAGLDGYDAGSIRLAGEPVDGSDPDAGAALRRSLLGFVFQAFHLIPHMNAAHNVAVPLLLNGSGARDALAAAERTLAEVGLAGRGNAMPAELSGGEQQRVALARALIHGPSMLLADEPTGNLDPATAESALALLARRVREHGAAMLLVTHSEQAAAIADRRLRLVNAHLVED